MSGKLTVEAIGIPVVTDIVAQPGDLLLVVNGVCVGVQKVVAKVTVRAPRLPRPVEQPATSDLFADDGPGSRSRRAMMAEVEQRVIGIIRENGPMDARHILDRMQLDTKERRIIGQKVWRMLQQGMLRRASGEQTKKQPKMIPA